MIKVTGSGREWRATGNTAINQTPPITASLSYHVVRHAILLLHRLGPNQLFTDSNVTLRNFNIQLYNCQQRYSIQTCAKSSIYSKYLADVLL